MIDKNISVIGLGYIGLPTAALLANHGYMVNGMDTNKNIIDSLKNGKVHIVEPEIDEYVSSALKNKKLQVSMNLEPADIYIICVPTPLRDGSIPEPDIDAVISAMKSAVPFLKDGDLIILESTSPVGTTQKIAEILEETKINNIHLAYCPERVMPGNILYELIHNDRVVGGYTNISTELVCEFYESFVSGAIHKTNSQTAEMCKLVENSYRDVNIAFANEISLLCKDNGVDVNDLIKIANYHPRVNILKPGIGVGGHCIAVDPWFLISDNPDCAKLIHQGRKTNIKKTAWVLSEIEFLISNFELNNKKKPALACFGLTYKPDTDDMRESPAKYIVDSLISSGNEILIVEPNINSHPIYSIQNQDYAIANSDICIFLVEHSQFKKSIDEGLFNSVNIIDFCGASLKL